MTKAEVFELSFEQISEQFGDPTRALFDAMYKAYPDLEHFRDDEKGWEPYMVEEIFMNLMTYADAPDTTLYTDEALQSYLW